MTVDDILNVNVNMINWSKPIIVIRIIIIRILSFLNSIHANINAL